MPRNKSALVDYGHTPPASGVLTRNVSTNIRRLGPWTEYEDTLLSAHAALYGAKNWKMVARAIPGRVAKQCRERYHNHLCRSVSKLPMSPEEDDIILSMYNLHGPKWATISRALWNRTDCQVKNRFNSHIYKKVFKDCTGHRVRKKTPALLKGTDLVLAFDEVAAKGTNAEEDFELLADVTMLDDVDDARDKDGEIDKGGEIDKLLRRLDTEMKRSTCQERQDRVSHMEEPQYQTQSIKSRLEKVTKSVQTPSVGKVRMVRMHTIGTDAPPLRLVPRLPPRLPPRLAPRLPPTARKHAITLRSTEGMFYSSGLSARLRDINVVVHTARSPAAHRRFNQAATH